MLPCNSGQATINARLIEATELAAERNDNWLLVQVTSAEAYAAAHVPGAVLIEPAELVSGQPPATGKLPDTQRLAQLLARIGYSPERYVVALDDEGGGWAGRLLWTLDCIGQRNWAYLNGGLQAWHGAGLPLAGSAVGGAADQDDAPAPAAPLALTIDRSVIAEKEDVLAAIDAADTQIWDVRSADEYLGRRRAADRVGHVPGAINLDWMALKNPADQMRLVPDLAALLKAHGIDGAGKTVITHCQTHHRSGLSYLIGRLLNFKDIRAYHGSWSEWGNDPDTPISNPAAGDE